MNATNTQRKQGLRHALRAHPDWLAKRQEHGWKLEFMTMGELESAHHVLYAKPYDGSDDHNQPDREDIPQSFPPQGADDDADDESAMIVAKLVSELRANRKKGLTEDRVIELVKAHAGTPATVNITIRDGERLTVKEGELMHYAFPALFAGMQAGVNIMLVGPAGSGKTTAAEQAAKLLGRDFRYTGALSSEYKLSGFIDAQGRVVSTEFRRMYETGGVFLFDEIDGSLPAPVLAFNAALTNGHADFPDAVIPRHDKFIAVAAANTFGRGSDRQYVGRNQLDAATLDRWAVLAWDYDTALENALIGLTRPSDAPAPIKIEPVTDNAERKRLALDWSAKVRRVRSKVENQKIRHVVSPRATINGLKLLYAGWPEKLVMDGVLYKGADADTLNKIRL